MFAFEEFEGEGVLGAIAFGPSNYRFSRHQNAFYAYADNFGLSVCVRNRDQLSVRVVSGDLEANYLLEPAICQLIPSVWNDLCGIIPAFREAARSGATELDIARQAKDLQNLIRSTEFAPAHATWMWDSDHLRALSYLRSATGLVDPWMLKLAGPIFFYRLEPFDEGYFQIPLWASWPEDLPKPLDGLKPTVLLKPTDYNPRSIEISAALVTSEETVRHYGSGLEEMKGLRDLEEYFGSADIANGLFDFAQKLRAS